MNEHDDPRSRTARTPRPVAGEAPHSLRNRLKDADPDGQEVAEGSKLSDEREELQAAARDRPAEPEAKRRRFRRAR